MNPKTEWLVAPDGKPALVNSSDAPELLKSGWKAKHAAKPEKQSGEKPSGGDQGGTGEGAKA